MKQAILWLMFTTMAMAQSPELIQIKGGDGWSLSLHPKNENIIYSSGMEGQLYRSNDGGENVVPLETRVKDFRISEILIDNEIGGRLYINASGEGRLSNDGGNTWEMLHQGEYVNFLLLNPQNNKTVYCVKNMDELWRSRDRAKTWEKLYTFGHDVRNIAISPSDTNYIYVNIWRDGFYFFRSVDGGDSWNLHQHFTEGVNLDIMYWEINPYNPKSVYALNSSYQYVRSTDGCKSFVKLTPVDGRIYSLAVDLVDTNVIYLGHEVGDEALGGGYVHKTEDNGTTWRAVGKGLPTGLADNLKFNGYALKISPHNRQTLYYSIGLHMGIWKSIDGGESWHQTALMLDNANSVYVPYGNPEHILLKDYKATYRYSTDNGKTWENSKYDVLPGKLDAGKEYGEISFHPDNPMNGMLAGGNQLFETMDGGINWGATNQLPNINYLKRHKLNTNILFAGLSQSAMYDLGKYRSVDNGLSWEYLGISPSPTCFDPLDENILYSFYFVDAFKSTDLGNTWEEIGEELTPLPYIDGGNRLTCMASSSFTSGKIYLGQKAISTDIGNLWMSVDYGETWRNIGAGIKEFDYYKDVVDIYADPRKDGRLFVACEDHGQPGTSTFSMGGLYLTENDGEDWEQLYEGAVEMVYLDSEEPANIYFSSKFGLMRMQDRIASIEKEEEGVKVLNYSLKQNYPNPFNPGTTISYAIKDAGLVSLKVYSILGEEVATLVNEIKDKGRYEAVFNASNLPSGVYVYRLNAGNFSATKKMLLIK